jgi:hypothetical protein
MLFNLTIICDFRVPVLSGADEYYGIRATEMAGWLPISVAYYQRI